MSGLFDTDGAFSRAGNMLADVFILNLIWLVFSLPLVTAGASTTALFYVATRRIVNKESYLFKDFLKSFKSNFVQATVVWVLYCAFTALLITNIRIVSGYSTLAGFMLPVYLFLLCELAVISIYTFPLIARFHMGYKELLKTALFMANKHFLTSAACALLALALAFITFIGPVFLLVVMGTYAFLASFLVMRVFRKYRPEIDADSE